MHKFTLSPGSLQKLSNTTKLCYLTTVQRQRLNTECDGKTTEWRVGKDLEENSSVLLIDWKIRKT
jgi:hypothetical protein